nr:MAG TPA: hypothetical protein [Bacteriophage sp.]
MGLEPTRSLLTRKFSYHTCFYTSRLFGSRLFVYFSKKS